MSSLEGAWNTRCFRFAGSFIIIYNKINDKQYPEDQSEYSLTDTKEPLGVVIHRQHQNANLRHRHPKDWAIRLVCHQFLWGLLSVIWTQGTSPRRYKPITIRMGWGWQRWGPPKLGYVSKRGDQATWRRELGRRLHRDMIVILLLFSFY